jgi:hypothetical protein
MKKFKVLLPIPTWWYQCLVILDEELLVPILNKGCCHTVALPFTWKSILRQKKNYGNSDISPCKNIIFKQYPLKETKILQDIITL